MMKRVAITLFGVLALILVYLLAWPVPIDPVAWDAPENQGYVGQFAANDRLLGVELVSLNDDYGAEDAAMGPDGLLYMTSHDGNILRYDLAIEDLEVFAQTDGRPLGIEFGPDGGLFVADAYRGLLRIGNDGSVTVLADSVNDGSPILFADDLDIASNGKIYLSDGSTRFGAKQWGGPLQASLMETIEFGRSGRVLEYDPTTDETRELLGGLAFANGVALTQDESSLLIVETGAFSIKKLSLDGSGEVVNIIENTPGYPDNINTNADGTFWVGLAYPRTDAADQLADKPFLRKMFWRLPFQPDLPAYGHVFRMDEYGEVLEALQDPSGRYGATTGLIEGLHGEKYITSVSEPFLAVLRED